MFSSLGRCLVWSRFSFLSCQEGGKGGKRHSHNIGPMSWLYFWVRNESKDLKGVRLKERLAPWIGGIFEAVLGGLGYDSSFPKDDPSN